MTKSKWVLLRVSGVEGRKFIWSIASTREHLRRKHFEVEAEHSLNLSPAPHYWNVGWSEAV